MKNPLTALVIVSGLAWVSIGTTPGESKAQESFIGSFISSQTYDFGSNDHLFSVGFLEGIKSELITDKIINVKALHGYEGITGNSRGSLDLKYISFSYENSAGPIKLSTGYIYTAAIDENLGLEDLAELGYREYKLYGHSADWYLAIDLSHSILLSDDVKLGFDAQISYLVDTFSEKHDRKVSMFFDVPLTLNNNITISPKFRYSRSLIEDSKNDVNLVEGNGTDRVTSPDIYGGVSITFAY